MRSGVNGALSVLGALPALGLGAGLPTVQRPCIARWSRPPLSRRSRTSGP